MKKLIALIGLACLPIAVQAADATNITITVVSQLDNGNQRTNTYVLRAGEVKAVMWKVNAVNAAAETDTNLVATTSTKYTAEIIKERIARLRTVYLQQRRATIQSAIDAVAENDAKLDDVQTAVENAVK